PVLTGQHVGLRLNADGKVVLARPGGARANVHRLVRVEGLAVLGEVPLECPVGPDAIAVAEVERDDRHSFLAAAGDRLPRAHVSAGAGPSRARASPRRPTDVTDHAGRIATVGDGCWSSLAVALLTRRPDASQLRHWVSP